MKKSLRRRQLRTTLILLLLAVSCAGTGLYFRAHSASQAKIPTVVFSQEDIDAAVSRYNSHTKDEIAQVITSTIENDPLKAELLFYGTSDTATVKQVLKALQSGRVMARFFFSSSEANTNKEMIDSIYNAGYPVGILNDGSSASLSGVATESVVSNLCRASLTIQAGYGLQPSSMLVFSEPTEELLYGAKAAYIEEVYYPQTLLSTESLSTQRGLDELIRTTRRGSLLCVRLGAYSQVNVSRLTALVQALSSTDLASQAMDMVASVAEEAPAPISMVHTTERALSFTFSGMGSDAELSGVLSALKGLNAPAMFFVTAQEIVQYEEQIKLILDAGLDLGLAVNVGSKDSESAVLEAILTGQELMRAAFGYDKELLLRPVTGNGDGALARAAAAGGFTLVTASTNMTQQADMRANTAEEVLERVLPKANGMLRRGEIVHFKMNMYQSSPTLLGKLVTLVANERSIYAIRSVSDILHNEASTYTYPVPDEDILPEVKDKIFAGQMTGNVFSQIQLHYIGIDWVNSTSFLPGFTKSEVKLLDQKGLIPNKKNMVFLTFDDWGTDETITKLLDVLKAHNAKATFFVRTAFVTANPNLLRAIAEDGHTIGSHTRTHYPLSNLAANGRSYEELTEEQARELQEDCIAAYDDLQHIVGDVKVRGRPALSRLFRPPTLAVGKLGLQTVLDCGYTYSVSGSYTTQDYKATSWDALRKDMVKYTESGSILIMHMSDNSIYTADALDAYLTYWEQKPPKTGEYVFASLLDGLE